MNEIIKNLQMSASDYEELLKEDKIIFTFPVLWHEWECDGTAWIMEKEDGTRYLKMTNHGGVYVAEERELIERLNYYSEVQLDTQKALALLQGSN
jgi:hypothetical protein